MSYYTVLYYIIIYCIVVYNLPVYELHTSIYIYIYILYHTYSTVSQTPEATAARAAPESNGGSAQARGLKVFSGLKHLLNVLS